MNEFERIVTDPRIDVVCGQRAVMLTTFRRSGQPVATPVGYGVDGDSVVFMTDSTAGKVKRLRHDARVRIAASTLRGAVRGPEVDGIATELVGIEAEHAISLITARNRLAWFFLLRRARRTGRTWTAYRVRLDQMQGSAEVSETSPVRARSSVASPRPGPRGRVGVGSVMLLVFAVGQFVSAICSAVFGGAFTTADRAGEPPIVPAGYAFAIWSVIELLTAGYAVWALWWRHRLTGTADTMPAAAQQIALIDRLAVPLAVTAAGFSAWLVAAELEPTWATLAVFAVMIIALFQAMARALHAAETIQAWPMPGRLLLWGTLGLYTGWSSIAIWLNLTTALAGVGAPISGPTGVTGQLAILAGATATAVAVLRWTHGLLPYAAAVVWALVGATIGATGAGYPTLAIVAMIGCGVVIVVTVVEHRRRPKLLAIRPGSKLLDTGKDHLAVLGHHVGDSRASGVRPASALWARSVL